MTTTPPNSTVRRVADLEREVESLRLRLEQADRPLALGPPRNWRLAVTVDVNYPAEDGSGHLKVPIKFLDATFVLAQGWQASLTTQTREDPGDDYQVIAANVEEDAYVPPGTIVIAFWQRAATAVATTENTGEWWFTSRLTVPALSSGGALMLRAVASENWCDTDETVAIESVDWLFSGAKPTPPTTVENRLKLAGIAGDVIYAVFNPDEQSSSSSSGLVGAWELLNKEHVRIEYLDKEPESSSSGQGQQPCNITANRQRLIGIAPPPDASSSDSSSSSVAGCALDEIIVLAEFTKVAVLDNLRVNGLCIEGELIEVVRLVTCDYADPEWVELFCGTDCSASSSSSG